MRDLIEIWVLQESGTYIFHHSKDEECDPTLFSSFFTALKMLGKRVSDSEIEGIMMKNHILMSYYEPEYNLTFVARSPNIKNQKKIHKTLVKIAQIFKSNYSKLDVVCWKGNLNEFETFEEKIYTYLHSEDIIENALKSVI